MQMAGLQPEDLKETFSRSGGPGGQHVNKVSTACTIRHVPTGMSVTASDSRSQSMNRQLALERLVELFEKRREEKRQERLAELSKSRRQKAKRSRATKRKLVEGKRRRGETKKFRGKVRESS
ncbi:MAG: peptide chain release factor-like protein [Chthoniobacterales bacterium]|nr:peptide chain release factor-like protein [Chthoniobacterales bacterium]